MPSPSRHAAADIVRRRLDGVVLVARGIRLLGWLGRVACIAAVAAGGAAASAAIVPPRDPAVASVVAGIATAIGAVIAWRLGAGPPPRRLDVASAAEATFPQIGERLSRAVDFLGDRTGLDGAGGLKDLAVADAAEALANCGRLPVPGLARHAPWLAAGCVALVAVFAVAPRMSRPTTIAGAARPADTAAESAHAADLAAAAATIAACATLEARMTAHLDARFALSPGVARDDIAAAEQGELDQLATIHAETVREIDRGRARVATLAVSVPIARTAAAELAVIDSPTLAAATAAIAEHRLATAAAATSRAATTLAAAARILGHASDEDHDHALGLAAAAPPQTRRLAAALAAVDRRSTAATAAIVSAARPVDDTQGPARPPAAPSSAGRGPTAPGVATAEPRFGGGADDSAEAPSEAAGPVGRVWRRLPERIRPGDARGGEPDVPAAYRQAIDLYYKSLLDAFTVPPATP